MGQTQTSGYKRDGVKCRGDVSIPCRPITLAEIYFQIRRNGTIHSKDQCVKDDLIIVRNTSDSIGLLGGCTGILNHNIDSKICGVEPVHEAVVNLLVNPLSRIKDDLCTTSSCISNQLRDIVMMEYCYIGKESWFLYVFQNYNYLKRLPVLG
jgi:hypothetical protein